ncbi:MAG: M23 family metallopeptidase, partial [Clostridiales bacterium]|nr:M23 family metallopeptidase [Clostridiales bacterium]
KKKIIITTKILIILISIAIIVANINFINETTIFNEEISETFSVDLKIIGLDNVEEIEKSEYEILVDYKYKTDKKYPLYISIDDEILYFTDERDRIYTFSNEMIKEVLSLDIFNEEYKYATAPKAEFIINDEKTDIEPVETNWNFLKLDGNFESSTNAILGQDKSDIIIINVKENAFLELNFETKPKEILVETSLGEKYTLCDNIIKFGNVEKEIQYDIKIIWNSKEYYGESSYIINILVDLPFEVEMIEEDIYPGDFITLYFKNVNRDESITINQPFVNKADLWEYESGYISIIPINYWNEEGNYIIEIESDNFENVVEIPVEIKDRKFNIQHLYIDEKIEAETRNEDAYEEFALYMNPAREISSKEALFEGLFIQPVEGRISTEFGMYRYVNCGMTSYRHSGIDIAITKGTPVMATNNGEVKLARSLILTGNTIVTDPGLGVFSVYYHLDSINVEKWQYVNKGDIVGTVGTTGFSTGPHLHWTMSYYKTNLDPYLFMRKEIITDILN